MTRIGDNQPNNAALRAQQAAQRGEQVYAKAKKESWGGVAIDYWAGAARNVDAEVKAGKTNAAWGNAQWATFKVMGFFAKMSGFDEVSGRGHQTWQLANDADATGGERAKAGAWFVFELGLAALNFTGVSSFFGKGAKAATAAAEGAEQLARFGLKEGAEAGLGQAVKGMLPAMPEAAGAVKGELAALLRKLPTAGPLGDAELKMLHEGLTAIGKKHGVELVWKTGLPQVEPEAGRIIIAATGAQWHETVHVVQAVQTQATALKSFAQRLGKEVAELTAKEVDQAYKATAQTLETQGYRFFEEHAFKAARAWKMKFEPATYKRVLLEGLEQFEKALVKGTMPEIGATGGAKAYGAMTSLGHSQLRIFLTLGHVWSGIAQSIKRAVQPLF